MRVLVLFVLLVSLTASGNPTKEKKNRIRILNHKDVFQTLRYPISARKEGLQARVVVYMDINENGKVESSRIYRSPSDDFNKEIRLALDKLQISPVKDSNGNPIASRAAFKVDFKLTE